MTERVERRPLAGAVGDRSTASRRSDGASRRPGLLGPERPLIAGLIGLSVLMASAEAGAVAPSLSTKTNSPAASAYQVAPDTPLVRATQPKAKTKASATPGDTRVAALPSKTVAPPPTPRVKPGPLTDKPKAVDSRAKAAKTPAKTDAKTAKKAAPSKAKARSGADPKVPHSDVAQATAQKHGVDPQLVHAVILAESAYNPKALSHKGAMGLMQLIPQTAARYGVKNAWNPRQNIDGGVRYLRDLLRQFGDIELALAAYNAGEKAVERYGNSIPPYQETQTYVARATSYLAKLQGGAPISKVRSTGSGVGGGLSGWGVIFGSFPASSEARQVLRDKRRALSSVISGGRSAVVHRKHESNRPYAALLVGLNQEKAVKACRHISGSGGYCLPIPPKQLRDPKALWR